MLCEWESPTGHGDPLEGNARSVMHSMTYERVEPQRTQIIAEKVLLKASSCLCVPRRPPWLNSEDGGRFG
jgi:hypothetical protein